MEQDNLRQALDLLRKEVPKPGEPDLRGFAWRYLWRQCQSQELFSLPGHTEQALCLAFSPDGRSLATGSATDPPEVKIWDLATRRARATLSAPPADPQDAFYDLSFSPGGRLLAAASLASVDIWDGKTFARLRSLPGSAAVAKFVPTGQQLLTAGTNGLTLWNTRTWTPVKTLVLGKEWSDKWRSEFAIGHFDYVRVAISPDGARLAVPTDDGVELYSVPDFRKVGLLKDRLPRVRFMAFSPDGRTLAACTTPDRDVKLWSVADQEETGLLSGHTDTINDAAFSPDGRELVTCSSDQTIKLWDVASRRLVRTFLGHAEEVYDAGFSPDGKLLASVGKDGSVKVWDPASPPPQTTRLRNSILPLGFNSEGDLVAERYGETNSILAAIDPESLQTLGDEEFEPGRQKGFGVRYWSNLGELFSDGRTAAFPMKRSASKSPGSEWLDLWDLSCGQFLCPLRGRQRNFVFAPKRRLLATATNSHTVCLWRIPSATRVAVLTNASWTLAFSPDETMLATYRDLQSFQIDIWDVSDAVPRRIATIAGGGAGVTFSPDSRLLAVGTGESLIKLWAIPSARLVRTLTGHKRSGIMLVFSPDGRTLASISEDIRLWQAATGRELVRFQIPMDDVGFEGLEFSPDGRSLAAEWMDMRGLWVQTWFAPSFAEIAVAEGRDYHALVHDAATWLDVGKALEKRNRLPGAIEAYAEAANRSTNEPFMDPVRHTALLRRSKLLLRQGQVAEAGADNCAAFGIPPRDPRTPARLIDLSAWYNLPLDCENLSIIPHRTPFLEGLPSGIHRLPGAGTARFDLRGVVQLGGNVGFYRAPASVAGIRVGQQCGRLLFLESAHFLSKEVRAAQNQGLVVADYVVHYGDGKEAEIPVRYGLNVRDWVFSVDPGHVPNSKVAWTGMHPRLHKIRIFEQTWTNPRPEVEIATLDFVSKMTKCAPFLIAVTAQ